MVGPTDDIAEDGPVVASIPDDIEPELDERDLPTVQGASNGRLLLGAALLGVSALAIFYLAFGRGGGEVGPDTNDSEIEYSSNQNRPAPAPPVVRAPVFPPPVEARPVPGVRQPGNPRRPGGYDPTADREAEARRRAMLEAEKARIQRLQQRLESPQLIIGGSGGVGGGLGSGDAASAQTRLDILRELQAQGPGAFGAAGLPGVGGATRPTAGANAGFGGLGPRGTPAAATPSLGTGSGDPNAEFFDAARASGVPTVSASQMTDLDTVIPQGTIIKGVLETAVNSDLPGMLRAVTTNDTYSFDGSRLLIPRASRMIGRYNSGVRVGQDRTFIIWERIITPDGQSILVDSPGTDELGTAGVEGDVDRHYFKRFGTAILLSIVEGSIEYAVAEASDNRTAINLGGNSDRTESLASRELERNINIPPTLYIDQGTRLNIFVSQDLRFPD